MLIDQQILILSNLDISFPTAEDRQQSTPINTEYNNEQSEAVSSTEAPCSIDHPSMIGPHNTHQYFSNGSQLDDMQMFQSQYDQMIVPMTEHLSIHTDGIQDCETDLSSQQLVVSAKGDAAIMSIKQAIKEKTNEIQQLKIKINDLLHKAESRKEQYQAEIAKRDQEIKSVKEDYEVKLADKDKKLQEARDEAARLKKDNEELEKKLVDELTQTRKEYDEKLGKLEKEKEVECLKLQLQHSEETKRLELEVKELKCQLKDKIAEVAQKRAKISELEKEQVERKLEEERRKNAILREQLLQQQYLLSTVASNQQQQVASSIASNDTIRIAPTGTLALQSITDRTANMTPAVPRARSNSASNIYTDIYRDNTKKPGS